MSTLSTLTARRPTILAMPITVADRLARPSSPGTHELNRKNPAGTVPATIELCEQLDIALPAEVGERYQRAMLLRSTPARQDNDTTRRQAINDLAAGTIDLAEFDRILTGLETSQHADENHRLKRHEALQKAAGLAYVSAAAAIRPVAESIVVDHLRPMLAQLIEQAAAEKYPRPDLEERYEQIHSLAAYLRWATGSVDRAKDDWWRYDRPELVWAWKVEQVEQAAKGSRVNLFHIGDGQHADGTTILRFVTPRGVAEPTLHEASRHPEFEPTVALAADVVANAARINQEQTGQ